MFKELNSKNFNELIETIGLLLDSLMNQDYPVKKKKSLIDVLKSMTNSGNLIALLNSSSTLFDKFSSVILELSESEGLKLFKPFSFLIISNHASIKASLLSKILENFFDSLRKVTEQLSVYLRDPSKISTLLKISSNNEQMIKTKSAKLIDSIIIHEEFFNCLMLSIEKGFPDSSFIKLAMDSYLHLICSLDLKQCREILDELYFTDLLNLVSRCLSFYSGLLNKSRSQNNYIETDIIDYVIKEVNKNIGANRPLVQLLFNFMNYIPNHLTRLKVDSFSFVKTFFEKNPEALFSSLNKILSDPFFFNSSKLRFTDIELNKIYYYWISLNKGLLKNHKKQILEHLSEDILFSLMENNIEILFERSIFPNYLLNLLQNLGAYIDLIGEKVLQTSKDLFLVKKSREQLSFFLIKLTDFLKQTTEIIDNIITKLKAYPEQSIDKLDLQMLSRLPSEQLKTT